LISCVKNIISIYRKWYDNYIFRPGQKINENENIS
jgi:hypothetical protein